MLTRYGGNSQRQGGDYEYYNDDFGYQRRSGTEIVDGEYKRGRGETVWASVKLNLNTCSKVCQHSDETLSALDQTLDIGHPSNLKIKYRRLIKVVFVKNPLGEMQHCCFHLKGNKYLFFMLCYYMPLCCFLPFPWAPIH